MKKFLSVFGIIGLLLLAVLVINMNDDNSSFVSGIKDSIDDLWGTEDSVPTETEESTSPDGTVETVSVSFNSGEASGQVYEVALVKNDVLILPACNYTAPEGTRFAYWSAGGVGYPPGAEYTLSSDTTFTALWEYYIPKGQYGVNPISDVEFDISFSSPLSVFFEESYDGVKVTEYQFDTIKQYLETDGNYYLGFFKDGAEAFCWMLSYESSGVHACWVEIPEDLPMSQADRIEFMTAFTAGTFGDNTDDGSEDKGEPVDVPNTIYADTYKLESVNTGGKEGMYYEALSFTSNGKSFTGLTFGVGVSGESLIKYGDLLVYVSGEWIDDNYKFITVTYSLVTTDSFYEVFEASFLKGVYS